MRRSFRNMYCQVCNDQIFDCIFMSCSESFSRIPLPLWVQYDLNENSRQHTNERKLFLKLSLEKIWKIVFYAKKVIFNIIIFGRKRFLEAMKILLEYYCQQYINKNFLELFRFKAKGKLKQTKAKISK